MLEALRNILGSYTPITNPDGTIPSGMAGVNMEYLLLGFIFSLCLYSVFRIIGIVISHIGR